MRATLGYLLVAMALLGGGEVFRRAATLEDGLATAQARLATQNPADTQAIEDAARAAAWGTSIPVVGRSITTDVRRLRALEAYWHADYAALEAPEPAGEPADAVTRLIAANAMFRRLAGQPRDDSQALTRGLDAVLKAYVSVLDVDPAAVDAAYDYEFVSRLRRLAAAGRANAITMPSRSNIHGDKGSPPKETTPREFNIIVPLQPDERQEQVTPQAGTVLERKG
jgi:hypothetical protein